LDVFVLSGATGVPVWTIFRGVLPFVVAILVGVVILLAFPFIATIVPLTM